MRELGWEVLMNPPYSLDLAPSDYHLFRSLKNSLNGVKLASKEACENHLVQFFVQKSQKFYSDGIMIVPAKWIKVIDQNGTCINDKCLKFIWINALWKTWKKPKLLFSQPNIMYIFPKSCIIELYFAYIFLIKWDVSDKIYLTYILMPSKYIFVPKSCICCIYILFLWRDMWSIFNHLNTVKNFELTCRPRRNIIFLRHYLTIYYFL